MKTLPKKPSKLQRKLLAIVKKNIGDDGCALLSYAELGAALKTGNSSVQYSIALLEKKSLLRVERGGSHQKTRFFLT
jgi:hypothetical protein